MDSNRVVIVAAKRTAIGNLCGSLSSLTAAELGSKVISEIIRISGIDGNEVSEVIMGQVISGGCGQNPARQASVKAGLPFSVPAWTINKVCGSGLFSVVLGYRAILAHQSQIVIAGGQESMSSAVHAVFLRNAQKMGNKEIIDTMIKDGLTDAFGGYHMGITAENIAEQFNITRQEQDEFACLSQQKAEQAQKSNRFFDEIVSVNVKSKKENFDFNQDEFLRYGTTIELLSKLRPAFKNDGGTVTAGNSSGINDGAAAVMLMSKHEAQRRNINVIADIVSTAVSGIDPAIMGIAPVEAIKGALTKADWKIEDLDLIEANEAFAAQSIAVNRELAWNTDKVNVNGGAIALGHPIGASGTRCLVTLLYEMVKRDVSKGLVSLCIGGGMGIAMCVQRV